MNEDDQKNLNLTWKNNNNNENNAVLSEIKRGKEQQDKIIKSLENKIKNLENKINEEKTKEEKNNIKISQFEEYIDNNNIKKNLNKKLMKKSLMIDNINFNNSNNNNNNNNNDPWDSTNSNSYNNNSNSNNNSNLPEDVNEELFIRGINYKSEEDDIKNTFSKYGEIVSCKILKDKETNKSKGICLVIIGLFSPLALAFISFFISFKSIFCCFF